MKTLIWRFRTREGSVRLGVAAPEDQLGDLYGELRGCATVADSLEEFLSLAVRAIGAHDGMLGDVMRQPWPSEPLKAKLRRVASVPDTIEAATAILDAAAGALPAEVDALLDDPANIAELDLIRGVAAALDENQQRFVEDLSTALRVPPDRLVGALDRLEG